MSKLQHKTEENVDFDAWQHASINYCNTSKTLLIPIVVDVGSFHIDWV